MIHKEGNDPQLYTITRKATNARRQSSNGSSTSSLYNNHFRQSPATSPIGSIPNDELDEEPEYDDEFPDEKHSDFDSKDLNEQSLKLMTFESANSLNTLNMAANYLDRAANDPLNATFFISNESSLQSRRHQLFMANKSNKQRKRKLKTVR